MNKEERKAYAKKWRDSKKNDPEFVRKEKERSKKWSLDNREKKNEYQRKQRTENREEHNRKSREYAREYKLKHPEWVEKQKHLSKVYNRNRRLQQLYGISTEIYDQIFETQGGKCLICGEATELVVDHDHNTGKVRGLLCNFCNVGLGNYLDNPELLKNAIRYLETHSS